MIRINQIKMPIEHQMDELKRKVAAILKTDCQAITVEVLKRSIDSRKKPDLHYVYSVAVSCENEKKILQKTKSKDISLYTPKTYVLPDCGKEALKERPVVVGAGPAGLFCALSLVDRGFCPILIERGKPVEERQADVIKFWETGVLDPSSNVVFGEGGAGTFSDGKLNTSVKDPSGKIRYVLQTFVRFGANESILYDNKPHIGTDVLITIMKNMRSYLKEKGCEILFSSQMIDFETENGVLKSVSYQTKGEPLVQTRKTTVLVLAPGHGARDTFALLHRKNILMQAKPFAVGFRVEHPQAMINEFAYGATYADKLPASPYKVTSNFPGGRGVYSFCMCPGGYVVNSSSEEKRLVVNGMSYSGRNSHNANSAIIVSVQQTDFENQSPLAGLKFQENLEAKTYELASGKIPQQLFGDYKNHRNSNGFGDYESCVKGAQAFADLRGILPSQMEEAFIAGMEHFGKIIPQFDRYDAILSGTETRTSSPVRMSRDEGFESNIKGLYPCGEGAGYAGAITSAAVDGMKVAEAIILKYALLES